MKNKVAYFGIFTALALIVSYVETLIPFYFGVPGIKLGLANLVVILALYRIGTKEAFVLSVTRVLLAGFLFGNLYSIIYSLTGAVLSFAVMLLMKDRKGFSVIGMSIAGGVAHNVGQVIVAVITVDSWSIAYYLPILVMSGAVTGWIIGLAVMEIDKRLPK